MIDAKTMMLNVQFTTGSTTVVGSGNLTLTLPAQSASGNFQELVGKLDYNGTGQVLALGEITDNSTIVTPLAAPSPTSPSALGGLNSGLTIPVGSLIVLNGILQLA